MPHCRATSPSLPAGLKAVEAKTPSRMIPVAPPTPWTPQTSNASSQRSRFFQRHGEVADHPRDDADDHRGHRRDTARRRRDGGQPGDRPGQRPTAGGRFSCHQPHHQPGDGRRREAATSVFEEAATAVTESTLNSLPALKPYQPNFSRPGAERHQRQRYEARHPSPGAGGRRRGPTPAPPTRRCCARQSPRRSRGRPIAAGCPRPRSCGRTESRRKRSQRVRKAI